MIIIAPHQGLGDHLICNGLYNFYAKKYGKVIILVKRSYFRELSNLLGNLKNVKLIKIPARYGWKFVRVIQVISKFFKIEFLGLGFYGENFFLEKIRFDHNFYIQANVPFGLRWQPLNYKRNINRERELFNRLKCTPQKYLFLHEDIRRGYIIDRTKLPRNIQIVEPLIYREHYLLVDYRLVLENAMQIHIIESSFSAFIESIGLDTPLFAHRYARPEALYQFNHEFTYKQNWTILLN